MAPQRIALALTICAFLALSAVIAWPRAGSATPDGFASVAAGLTHTCAITIEGGVKCWGRNSEGQLGDGTGMESSVPVNVLGLDAGAAAVAAGDHHTCAVTAEGGVKCWGFNFNGQLGNDTRTSSATPVDVTGLASGVAALAAGPSHTCALTSEGRVKCWGNNRKGQLGDGTRAYSSTPVDVLGLSSGVVVIAAGGRHTCALTTDGVVKCWGRNYYGQLGNGTTTGSTSPVEVVGLSGGVAAIAAGMSHTCAVTSDGAAKCWGSNLFRQLGDGKTNGSTTPVQVVGLSGGVAAIAAGSLHTCVLTEEGGVKCWGQNGGGQLGDGTREERPESVDVAGLESGVTTVALGLYHTCGVAAGGVVKCWGWNYYGQLGDGTTVARLTPVDVVGFKLIPTPTPCPDGKTPSDSSCTTPGPYAQPGMSISGPRAVLVGETFMVSINADPAPSEGVAGFASEVALPAAIEWLERPDCADEVRVTVDGSPPVLCARGPGLAGEVRHVAASGFTPPLPPLDTPLEKLLELDAVCNAPGTHDLVLTALSSESPFAASYFTTDALPLHIQTIDYDGTPVADTHQVTCLDPALDDDGDGCTNGAELGADATLGGQRDPANFWDFYDVPTGEPLARDGSVNGLDLFAVIARVGTEGDPTVDPLSSPPETGYHPAFDRGTVLGPNAWNIGPADGSISAPDVFALIAQFGHSCG